MTDENKLPKCSDCAVPPGSRHEWGCDVARCASTGVQLLQCPGEIHIYDERWYGEHEGRCIPTVWTGEWPGVAFCRRMGWYTSPNSIWGRLEDLNKLAEHFARGAVLWNPETEEYEI